MKTEEKKFRSAPTRRRSKHDECHQMCNNPYLINICPSPIFCYNGQQQITRIKFVSASYFVFKYHVQKIIIAMANRVFQSKE